MKMHCGLSASQRRKLSSSCEKACSLITGILHGQANALMAEVMRAPQKYIFVEEQMSLKLSNLQESLLEAHRQVPPEQARREGGSRDRWKKGEQARSPARNQRVSLPRVPLPPSIPVQPKLDEET